jgi:phosphoglycerate dehydrogenase-like enzyme
MTPARLSALYVLGADASRTTYGPEEQRRIAALVNVLAPPQTPESALTLPADILSRVEVLISGWGGPVLDAEWLRRMPSLKALFYGAGSVSRVMTLEAWRRDLIVTSAYEANAVPVAEYALAMIILCLKRVWLSAAEMRAGRGEPRRDDIAGCYERVVGLVSLGAVGRAVASRLSKHDVSVIAYDPRVSRAVADSLGVTLVSLHDLFADSDVVSVHAPELPSTRGLITGALLSRMKSGASFINTARGSIVREDELIAVATRRADLQVVLDVTEQIPADPGSMLYALPNVLLTPHIAGSCGLECRRMGRFIVRELERYVAGESMRSRITFDAALTTSHAPQAVRA